MMFRYSEPLSLAQSRCDILTSNGFAAGAELATRDAFGFAN